MQNITVKGPETQLATQAQAAEWQINKQPLPRVQDRHGKHLILSQRVLEHEIYASNEVEYDDDNRHWSPSSQPYAPADILFQYLREGWLLGDTVVIQVIQCFSGRCVEIYHFQLSSSSGHVSMPIIANPVILRLIVERGLTTLGV